MNHTMNGVLSRRRMLAMSGAAVALPGVLRAEDRQAAAAVQPDLQGAGFFRRKVGSFDVALVSDGAFAFKPPYPLFGQNVGEEKVKAALETEFIAFDQVTAHVNTLLIKTGKEVVLVDTGCGQLFGPTTGKLLANLGHAGVKAGDITAVVLTHVHGDHVGGLLGPSGADAFSNAQYFVHKDEAAFWGGANPDLSKSGIPEEGKAGFIQGAQSALKNIAKKLKLLDGDATIAEGIEAIAEPGHTPGHLTLLISSGNEQLYYIADAVHHYALTMAHPEYYMGFDTDREMGVKARQRVLDRAAADRLLVAGAHLPFPGFGHVRKTSDGFGWVPSTWEW